MPIIDKVKDWMRGPDTVLDREALVSGERQDWLRECADLGADRLNNYRLFDDYVDGEQRTQLLDRAQEYLEASGLRYCENFTESVVDAQVDRMHVRGFDVAGNREATDWLTDHAWARNRMASTAAVVHHDARRLGDAFVLVEWDEDMDLPRYVRQDPYQIKPVYEDGELLYLVKVWPSSRVSPTNPQGRRIRRMNLYFPDRVEKWFTASTGENSMWGPHLDFEDLAAWDDDTGEPVTDGPGGDPVVREDLAAAGYAYSEEFGAFRWPTPWTMDGTPDGEPLGPAIIHFANRARGAAFGRSEVRGVIPQQDALNKALIDLFYVLDAQGWPQRYATGVQDAKALRVAIGEYLTSADTDAKFGQLDAADPRKILESVEAQLKRIAARNRIPLHMLVMGTAGNLPSGESLKTSESGLTARVRGHHTSDGDRWADTQRLGHRLASAFATVPPPPLAPDDVITTLWEPPESRSERDEAETLESHQRLGASRRTVLAKLGYDPDEEAVLRAEEAKATADAAQRAFDEGDVDGEP